MCTTPLVVDFPQERPYYFDLFRYINETHFYVECMYLDAALVAHDQIWVYSWINEQIEIVSQQPGALYPGGFMPIIIPPESPYFWYFGSNGKHPSILGINSIQDWTNTSAELQIPSEYGYVEFQGGFVDDSHEYLICSSGVTGSDGTAPVWKLSLPDGQYIANLTSPSGPMQSLTYTFKDYKTGKGMAVIANQESHLEAHYVQIDFDTMEPVGNSLIIQYPYWTVYGGTAPWNAGAFDGDSFFVIMSVDHQPIVQQVIHQIELPTDDNSSPLLIDSTSMFYQYNHNLIGHRGWLYCDTGPATISRWKITPNSP